MRFEREQKRHVIEKTKKGNKKKSNRSQKERSSRRKSRSEMRLVKTGKEKRKESG
jgi:hypothetical protein